MDAYRIAYDGRAYHGFQRQPDIETVSDAILAALGELGVIEHGAVPPGYTAAGRTDAGVSAVAQTVAFEAPDWLGPSAFNSALPADIRAWAHADAAAEFHATRDASWREYTYYLHAPAADTNQARTAAGELAGRHDFHNLTPDDQGTEREISIAVDREDPFLVLVVRADGFPRQLVRRLVTVIESVATASADPGIVDRVLGDEPLSGPAGIGPAPPEPLVLTAVKYPDLTFEVDADAVASARAIFDQRRIEQRTAAAVSGVLADLPTGGQDKRQRLGAGEPTREP